jgi:hypothetical protein
MKKTVTPVIEIHCPNCNYDLYKDKRELYNEEKDGNFQPSKCRYCGVNFKWEQKEVNANESTVHTDIV